MKADNATSDLHVSIKEDDFYRLWRAHHAAALLAALNNDMAIAAGIGADNTSAVADYIQQELLEVLGSATMLRSAGSKPGSPPTAADLI